MCEIFNPAWGVHPAPLETCGAVADHDRYDNRDDRSGAYDYASVVQVEPLRVEVVLPMVAWGKLKARSPANVSAEGFADALPATVSVVDTVFDSASGTFGVRLELPNAGGKVPAGIRCKVDFPSLRGIAAEAEAAERNGDLDSAAEHWERALPLLPSDSAQHKAIVERTRGAGEPGLGHRGRGRFSARSDGQRAARLLAVGPDDHPPIASGG